MALAQGERQGAFGFCIGRQAGGLAFGETFQWTGAQNGSLAAVHHLAVVLIVAHGLEATRKVTRLRWANRAIPAASPEVTVQRDRHRLAFHRIGQTEVERHR